MDDLISACKDLINEVEFILAVPDNEQPGDDDRPVGVKIDQCEVYSEEIVTPLVKIAEIIGTENATISADHDYTPPEGGQ